MLSNKKATDLSRSKKSRSNSITPFVVYCNFKFSTLTTNLLSKRSPIVFNYLDLNFILYSAKYAVKKKGVCCATPDSLTDLQITHFWRSTLTPKGLANKAEVHSMFGNLSSNLVSTFCLGMAISQILTSF